MKTIVDNEVTNRIGAVYDENDNDLSWSIGPDGVYDEN